MEGCPVICAAGWQSSYDCRGAAFNKPCYSLCFFGGICEFLLKDASKLLDDEGADHQLVVAPQGGPEYPVGSPAGEQEGGEQHIGVQYCPHCPCRISSMICSTLLSSVIPRVCALR